ncbi:MAG: TetR family transcriptional regulator [Curvibacter sp. PD_MW3]|nr:MAG: TetR family transcriptional regulator [Curvibacter sp. PD_MW3]
MSTHTSAAKPARKKRQITDAPESDGSPRNTLTPERWIDAATEVLAYQGIDRVRVDLLAQQLGVTRGSFYWHFRDREDLLRRVLRAWHELATEQLTVRLEHAHSDAIEQLRDVVSLPFRGRSAERAARIELAIRAWARRDDMARHAVDEADASRIGYIAQIFSSLGFAIGEARSRAFLLYSYVVAESQMSNQGTSAQRMARSRLVEKLLTQVLQSDPK